MDISRPVQHVPNVLTFKVQAFQCRRWQNHLAAWRTAHSDSASALTLNELRVSTMEKLADSKVPEVLKAVSAIPRNALGKIDRKTLQSLLYRESAEIDSHRMASGLIEGPGDLRLTASTSRDPSHDWDHMGVDDRGVCKQSNSKNR
jgi:hypothetical protein